MKTQEEPYNTKKDTAESIRLPEDLILVIGRQYGSGGRMIGKQLADRLGLRYYDKELLSEAARHFGICPEVMAHADEKKPNLLRSLFISSYGVTESYGPETLSAEGLYKVQSCVIDKIADEGGCVIVGRTADYVLRHRPHVASIFLHSCESHRCRRIVERGEAPNEKKALELLKRNDKERESYYNYFTGRHWGAASNYDLTVDASLLGNDAAIEIIELYLRKRFGK